MRNSWLLWWLVTLFAVAVLGTALFRFTPQARMRRRRRKNHSRVISKARHPSVRLSVRPPGKSE